MSNIGREVVNLGKVVGTVVEEVTIRGKAKLKIKLADHMPRNPALGDYQIVGVDCEFADARRGQFSTQEELVAEYNSDRRYRAELRRAGGDATLLRR